MNGTPPNILFLLADDQRFDALGAAGNAEIQTPNLDVLAARGTRFTRAHIPGGTNGAVCMPSRAMIHTGRTLFRIEREGQKISAAHATLGETFRAAGYHTHHIGKWHNGVDAFARGFSGGDEIFFGGMYDHWNVPAHRFDPAGRYASRLPIIDDFMRSNRVGWRSADHVAAGRHSTDLFTDAALRFLREYREDRPFLLNVAFLAPHDPRSMPERFRALYDPARLTLPENFQPEHSIDTGALRIRDEVLAAFPRTPDEVLRHLAEYYAMISHLDDGVGRILDALRETGRADNTVVVFAGDNGLAVGQHGLMGKQNLYEHSVRVPLIFAGPGVPPGARSDALALLSDIFPTLCGLCGVTAPETVEGRGLASCFSARAAAPRTEIHLAYCDSIRGVTNGRHKLIEYACGATQLFDLTRDPGETRNLAERTESRALVKNLRVRLAAGVAKWDDARHPLGRAFARHRPDLALETDGD